MEAAFHDACAISMCVMHCVSDLSSHRMAVRTLAFGHDANVNALVFTNVLAVSANQQSQTDAYPPHEIHWCTLHEHKVGQHVHV